MLLPNQAESIKMGIDLASIQQHPGNQYDVLIVVRDEIQRLIDKCVQEMRVDQDE